MSKDVIGKTLINNSNILAVALTELGIKATETSAKVFTWGTNYRKVTVDLNEGEIHYDDMYASEIQKLEQTYSKHFIMEEVRKKGHRIESVNIVNDEIEIIASY